MFVRLTECVHAQIVDKFPIFQTKEKPPSTADKINRIFWIALGSWTAYNLLDIGLSRVLALETLIHGTGPLGYIGINLFGADPSYGGNAKGSSAAYADYFVNRSKNYFHVFNSSYWRTPILARGHAVLSGMATFGYHPDCDTYGNKVKAAIGGVAGFVTPTVKFRFTPDETTACHKNCFEDARDARSIFVYYKDALVNLVLPHNEDPLELLLNKKELQDTGPCPEQGKCSFEYDLDHPRANKHAYKTTNAISIGHIGISGSLLQGMNKGMFSRMYNAPAKVLTGMALIGAAAYVAKKTYNYYHSSKSKKCDKQKLDIKILWTAIGLTAVSLNTI